MAFLTGLMDPATGLMDPRGVGEKGLELHAQYAAAKPFPNITINDFMPPELLERCLDDFPASGEAEHGFARPQERLKRSYTPELLPPRTRQLFHSLNSRPFVQLVENITGIKGLIPDPYFSGGGFHEIREGGHLSIHADFNHHVQMNLERRVNVLIYLNKNWADEYGGQLELWENSMTHCIQSIVPLFNRCVIFSTTSKSNHGNPTPISHPEGVPRCTRQGRC